MALSSKWASQQGQPARVVSTLGADALLLTGFSVVERLGEPFTITIDVLSRAEFDFMPHLGTGFGIAMSDHPLLQRSFNGILFEAQHTGDDDEGVRYRLTLRPWASLMATGVNTRLFQKMSALQIIEQVIKKAGFSGYEIQIKQAGRTAREYCVQYRESDFAFISRLMEEEGVYYFYKHKPDSHVMVLCDDPSSHPLVDPAVAFHPEGAHENTEPHLTEWGERVRPGVQKVSLRDSHFRDPQNTFSGEKAASEEGPNDKAEIYDFPGGYSHDDDAGSASGATYAQLRLQASRAERRLMYGRGTIFSLGAGSRIKIKGHGHKPYNEEVLLVGAVHTYVAQSYASGGGEGVDMAISVEATPAAVVWRPMLRTPKPLVAGPQTALVVGPEGEVIHVDDYGRIRVKFYWDRRGGGSESMPTADQRSCWVRVSQGWADGGFGAIHIPRVGEEVIVDFLEGDPDRPIVTGRVYNGERMPPYPLPAEKTKSTWKSQTVGEAGQYDETEEPPSGGSKGFNEFRFEDKGGKEEVFLHAQRDYKAWVRHDEQRKTGRDVAVRVGRDRKTEVKKNETLIVETGDETREVKKGSRKTTINKADELTVETGDKKTTVSMANYSVDVSKGKATVVAMQEILLKVGGNTVKISPMGIEIKGLTVKITADTTLEAQGLKSDIKASTMMTINGALVMIN